MNYYQLAEKSFMDKDYPKAVQYYEKGVQQGDVQCMNALGYCYDEGYGVNIDSQKSFELYFRAASIGFSKAQRNLGLWYQERKNDVQAFIWFKQAAIEGFEDCIWKIAKMYHNGKGVKRDLSEAIKWYEIGANKGNKYAALTLAKLYDYDDEIENDRDKAIYWYKIAANLGLAEAQNHYGFILAQQELYDMAFEWYEKAAKQNYEEAIANLGYCYLYGRGVQKDKEKARELLENCHMDYLYIPDELYEDDEDEEWN